MQIEIDFEVFKALTAQLRDERESYNDVIRRLLNFADHDLTSGGEVDWPGQPMVLQGLLGKTEGVWFSNVFFPEGTRFRATYKGKTYTGQIKNLQWLDENGQVRTSPSDAANAVSDTNVNGWRFWFAQRPYDQDWRRLDEFR